MDIIFNSCPPIYYITITTTADAIITITITTETVVRKIDKEY